MAFTHDFSSVQALPFANGTAVFDDAFPGARATVLTGGPEQSEVIYDGGFVRTRPNDCLHKVGEEQVTRPPALPAAPAGSATEQQKFEAPEALVARINAAHRDIEITAQIAAMDIVRKAMAIGDDLLKLKPQIEEGRWVRYLDQYCAFSRSTAYNYIALAESRSVIEANFQRVGNNLSLRGALKLITKKPTPPEPTEGTVSEAESPASESLYDTAAANGDDAEAPGAVEPTDGEKSASLPKQRSRKSGFDAKHYASVLGFRLREDVDRLIDLSDEYPERFEAVLEHILSDHTVVDALAELAERARHPKIGALIAAVIGDAGGAAPDGHFEYPCNPAVSEFFSQAGGGDIFDWIPADRRDEVCRGFLDRLTVAGTCKVMSDEFGRQLRARLPAPKRNEQLDIEPYSLPDDGSIPLFLRRVTDADKKAIAEIQERAAERKRLKTMSRIAKLKAKQSGALRKMPTQGKDALALINADEVACVDRQLPQKVT
jgi:hypothetical protein